MPIVNLLWHVVFSVHITERLKYQVLGERKQRGVIANNLNRYQV